MYGAYHKPLPLFTQQLAVSDGISDLLITNRSGSVTTILGTSIRTFTADSPFRQITTVLNQNITFINGQNLEIR